MSFSVVCGKLGAGKTSFAVSQAYRYLKQGRRVAANFALDFTLFKDVDPDSHVVVLSDIPVADDLISLGRGGPSEEKAGLLIIDEGLFCLNSRGWAGGDRQKLIEFFALTRKLGWDVILIIQHIQAMDKQIRIEGHTDNVPIGVKLRERFATNWELSTARATSVVRYLIEEGGIDRTAISAGGYADTRPVEGNDTEGGKAANRRIEIVLYPKDLADIVRADR